MKATTTPVEIEPGIREKPFPFLLESSRSGTHTGDSTYTGADPFLVLTTKGNRISVRESGREETWTGDPFDALESILRDGEAMAVGWFGYNLGRHIERLPAKTKDDLGFPDLYIALHDRVHHRTRANPNWRTLRTERRARDRAISASGYRELGGKSTRGALPRTFSKEEYLRAIRVAKEYIAAGDIYQVNLSQRFETNGPGPWEVYERLREASPAPYSALLELGGKAILSSSPEQFLRVSGEEIVTRPIKGTRPRMSDPGEDEKMRRELLSSPKDDAELAMIVDLERNDLGRVCTPGSVRVEEEKSLESHPTVHHLASTIRGKLRPEVGIVELLKATFPGGSVTGAPKIRAMEIIDELEPTNRGVYTGAIGMIGPGRNTNLSIAIRVLHHDSGRYGFQAGGAIVADSDEEAEYQETLFKARGMAAALGMEWNTSL